AQTARKIDSFADLNGLEFVVKIDVEQDYEYVKFFASVCGVELPDHAKIAAELITSCHTKGSRKS
ncbi:MAG: hypothetical protein ACEY3C_02785, partial [Candidatus Tisiphia sp.]